MSRDLPTDVVAYIPFRYCHGCGKRHVWRHVGVGSIYRARMRLLHRLDLCWMQPLLLRTGDNDQWVNVWCHWCGVRGRRLDTARAVMPLAMDVSADSHSGGNP